MIEITITMGDDGNVNVKGPLGDRRMMYALLEIAKDIVRDMANKSQNLIQPANIMPSGIIQ